MSGKLLFISDIEGCLEKSMAGREQSRVMCTEEFFMALQQFLDQNPMNKIAFLGDYFDQGDGVVNSINKMMELYTNNPGRIHILLGNRDLNKYRFIYEMNIEQQGMSNYNAGKRWIPIWNKKQEDKNKNRNAGTTSGFYNSLKATTTLKARMAEILGKSMGAGTVPKLHPGLTPNQSCYLMLKMMSQTVADEFQVETGEDYSSIDADHAGFVKNVRQLFTVGNVVTYDPDFKTLMSHAGGVSPSFFHTQEYYDQIFLTLNPLDPYYDTMELVRRALMTRPKEGQMIDTFTPEILAIYNQPAKECAELFENPLPSPPLGYFLIQALGLKGDGGKPFASFVNSCDVAGCSGPLPYGGEQDGMNKFFGRFKGAVKVISHGHVPHCAPVPLVYTRAGISIVIIDNDTSNGYRPKKTNTMSGIDTFSDLPLAYVTSSGEKVGVAGLTADGTLDATPFADGFESMIGEWNVDDAPVMIASPAGKTETIKEKGVNKQTPVTSLIQYNDGKALAFLGGYNPARLIDFSGAAVGPGANGGAGGGGGALAGGRRRKMTRRQKKQRRGKTHRKTHRRRRNVRN